MQHILITGGNAGIGKATAIALAKKGAKIIIASRNDAKAATAVAEIKAAAKNEEIYSLNCDLASFDSVRNCAKNYRQQFGQLDILINNAGIWHKVWPLTGIDTTTIDAVIQTNLLWLIHCTRLFLPALESRDEAAIINISSKAWVVAQEWLSAYSASKYWVRGFTDVLKTDLKWSSVRVAGVYQSGTNTQMFNKTGEDFPIQKFTDPADLADVIAYMLMLPDKIWLHDVRVAY